MFGQDVVIIGGGVMGLFHVVLAKLSGTRVILSEPNAERRKLAEELGADLTFDPTKVDAVNFVKEHTEGRGAEVVFNTTALPQIAKQAMDFTATGGAKPLCSARCIRMSPCRPIWGRSILMKS